MTLIHPSVTVGGSGDPDDVGVLIDGVITAGSGPEMKLENRRDGSVLARVNSAGPAEVASAYAAAATEAPRWAALGPAGRAEVLHRAAGLFRERAELLAPIISAEMGKPASEATVEVAKGAAVLDYYAELGYRRLGATFSTDADEDVFTLIEPLGVVALITPWNFPFTIPIRKLSAALAAGNAVVFKPSADAAVTGLTIAATLLDAGVPAGLLHAVVGSIPVIEEALLTDPRLHGVSLTGSYEAAAAIRRRLPVQVPFQAELGGKNTIVVWADAKLDKAVDVIVASSFRNNGQICTAAGRLLVHDAVHEDLLALLTRRLEAMTENSGADQLGILVSDDEAERVEGYVKLAEQSGSEVVRPDPGGWNTDRVAPALLVDPAAGPLTSDEIFGPVVTFERIRTLAEAIESANATAYGLTSGIVTEDIAVARRFWQGSDAGTVKVNAPLTGIPFHVPFEGYGRSGAGWAEGGEASLDFFTRTKTVYLRS
ncbi:MAG: aldehyde dehydrogenase family protein [Acidimicrobiaceae bacterium]|nr:aldehyde dehydrogenase family protein [Acidimicrobiaceae bacterium]